MVRSWGFPLGGLHTSPPLPPQYCEWGEVLSWGSTYFLFALTMKNAFLFLLAIVGGTAQLGAQCSWAIDMPYAQCSTDGFQGALLELVPIGDCEESPEYGFELEMHYNADYGDEVYGPGYWDVTLTGSTHAEFVELLENFTMPVNTHYHGFIDFYLYALDGSSEAEWWGSIEIDAHVQLDIEPACEQSTGVVQLFPLYYLVDFEWDDIPGSSTHYKTYGYSEDSGLGYDFDYRVMVATQSGTFGFSLDNGTCPTTYDEITLSVHPDPIPDCASSVTLESGEAFHIEQVCGPLETVTYACDGFNGLKRVPYWFKINSSDSTNVSFAFEYGAKISSYNVFMELYRMPEGGTCDDLVHLGCTEETGSTCMNVEAYEDVLPNTDYYIRTMLIPQTEIHVMATLSTLGYQSCGCTDPNSCNYSPNPLIEDCPAMGCTDPDACNYWMWAECDSGSCYYPDDVAIEVYHDTNYNGIQNWYEVAIGGFGEVVFAQNGEVIYTVIPNLDGEGTIVDPSPGEYQVYFSDPGEGWIPFDTLTFNLPQCNGVELGVVPTPDAFDQYSTFVGTAATELHCEFGLYVGFWMLNTGTEPLDGTVTIGYEDVLEVSPLGTAWSDNTDGVATWNITGHPPGIARYYALDVEGPPVEYIGQAFPFEVSVEITDDVGTVIYAASQSTEATVICAYDPNDITVMSPQTYFDPEFIDDDTETAVYRIRFQNTGNAPATDVVVVDELDDELFDLSSFAPLSGSHEFYTIPEPDGRVSFVFENINLPDSTADLEGSQGEVYFQIDLLESMQPEDWVSNSAEIYFDSNPPIYTNVSTHQLFNCDWMEVSYSVDLCGPSPVLDPTPLMTTHYEWPGTGIVNDALPLENPEPGTNTVPILLSNPMCTPQEAAVTYTWQEYLPEDLDQNGLVDSNDFLTVLGTFGCAGNCTGDITLDTVVGTQDLLAVIAAFGLSCD